MSPISTVPLTRYLPDRPPEAEAKAFFERLRLRRSVRMFSDRDVSLETIQLIISAAGSAPSGANKQPWRFVAVRDPAIKREIRLGAEAEEREFYERRATPQWLADLAPLGTDADKGFLEVAPWLIVVFKLTKGDPAPALERGLAIQAADASPTGASPTDAQRSPDASSREPARDAAGGQVYYAMESVGIACGMLLTAIHMAGLVSLTHTPSPMAFLGKILRRPEHERPFLLVPVGYPASDCRVPDIHRKSLEEILVVT
ncbi:MAG: nitroreductase family protein [Planctomycetota bacterium]|nr:nitroreductase family protein [Planctomycetota bacterium]